MLDKVHLSGSTYPHRSHTEVGKRCKKNWTVIIDYFQKAEQTLRIEHLYLENKAPKIDTSQDGQDMFLHRINAVMLVLIMCPSAYP